MGQVELNSKMRRRNFKGRTIGLFAAIVALSLTSVPVAAAEGAKVINLTQTGCQFLESETADHKFKTMKAADCVALNAKTGADRLAKAPVLKLAPGRYVFRVSNRDVPYELGFWLRSKGYDWKNPLHKVTKTSVSGGGLVKGATKDYEVTLKPGEYEYSCPLNPTPDYRIIVGG